MKNETITKVAIKRSSIVEVAIIFMTVVYMFPNVIQMVARAGCSLQNHSGLKFRYIIVTRGDMVVSAIIITVLIMAVAKKLLRLISKADKK